MLNYVAFGLLAAVVALGVYVRVAPSKPAVWHRSFDPLPPGQRQSDGGFQIVINVDSPQATLAALDTIIMATPRTTPLAGSVEAGMITYITRTRVWGFPDYTTVWTGPDSAAKGDADVLLNIDARLRFGKSDLGVNRARVEGWLVQLTEALT